MMFVVMSYDIGEKRGRKVHNIASKYLIPVQKSLFQGFLTEKQLRRLQNELSPVVDPDDDKLIFYKTDGVLQIDEVGTFEDRDMIL